MKKRDVNAPATVGDLDDLATQITDVIIKVTEPLATKEELKKVEAKLEAKIDSQGADIADIRRRLIDLEVDTVSRTEFNALKAAVTR